MGVHPCVSGNVVAKLLVDTFSWQWSDIVAHDACACPFSVALSGGVALIQTIVTVARIVFFRLIVFIRHLRRALPVLL